MNNGHHHKGDVILMVLQECGLWSICTLSNADVDAG